MALTGEKKQQWRKAYRASGRYDLSLQRHFQKKQSLGLARHEPLSDELRARFSASAEAARAKRIRPCKACGTVFIGRFGHHEYCSAGCRSPAHQGRSTAHSECVICGNNFYNKRPTANVCSADCRKARRRSSRLMRGDDNKYRARKKIVFVAARELGLIEPCENFRPRDNSGWRIPSLGTKSRAIYDLAIEGWKPISIAAMCSLDLNEVKSALSRLKNPDIHRRHTRLKKPPNRRYQKQWGRRRRATMRALTELGFAA